MENLIFLICFSIFAILTAIAMLLMGFIFSYKNPQKEKSTTYECGLTPKTSARTNFNIKYFNYITIFLLFETACSFLYPIFATGIEYSKVYKNITVCFIILLLFGLVIAIKHKYVGN